MSTVTYQVNNIASSGEHCNILVELSNLSGEHYEHCNILVEHCNLFGEQYEHCNISHEHYEYCNISAEHCNILVKHCNVCGEHCEHCNTSEGTIRNTCVCLLVSSTRRCVFTCHIHAVSLLGPWVNCDCCSLFVNFEDYLRRVV